MKREYSRWCNNGRRSRSSWISCCSAACFYIFLKRIAFLEIFEKISVVTFQGIYFIVGKMSSYSAFIASRIIGACNRCSETFTIIGSTQTVLTIQPCFTVFKMGFRFNRAWYRQQSLNIFFIGSSTTQSSKSKDQSKSNQSHYCFWYVLYSNWKCWNKIQKKV